MSATPPNDPAAAAAAWYARTRADDGCPHETAALDRWMREDAAHAAAWDRVARTDALLGGMADDPAIVALRAQALAPPRRHGWIRYAAAAALVAGVGVTTAVVLRPSAPAAAPAVRYASGVGEVRPVALADGSTVTLDAASAVAVAPFGAERRIALTQGRALFAVAKDKAHPFTVTAGATAVTALGTRFSVERRSDATTVALVEGSVRVTTPLGSRVLAPGEVLTLAKGGIAVAPGAAEATGWTSGRLDFEEVPLADVAATLARYDGVRIAIPDRTLAAHPFSGTLKAKGGTEALLAALKAYRIAHVARRDATTIVLAAD